MTVLGEDRFVYTYNDLDQVKQLPHMFMRYIPITYDKAGRRTGLIYSNGKEICYSYDKLDRLTGVSYPDGEVKKYSYDNEENRISKTVISLEREEEVISYTYDFSNRMIRAGNVRYEYDKRDRMVRIFIACEIQRRQIKEALCSG